MITGIQPPGSKDFCNYKKQMSSEDLMEVMNVFLSVHECKHDDTLADLSSFTPEGTAHGQSGDRQSRTVRIDCGTRWDGLSFMSEDLTSGWIHVRGLVLWECSGGKPYACLKCRQKLNCSEKPNQLLYRLTALDLRLEPGAWDEDVMVSQLSIGLTCSGVLQHLSCWVTCSFPGVTAPSRCGLLRIQACMGLTFNS